MMKKSRNQKSSSAWTIAITQRNSKPRVRKSSLKALLRELLQTLEETHVNMQPGELSVLFTNDKEVKDLNFRFRKKNKPTDVLSFPHYAHTPAAKGPAILGDIVISLETAKLQAKRFQVSLAEETVRLLVHGTLHLFGFDHEGVPAKEAARMRRRERSLLKAHRRHARGLFSTS